MRRSPSQFLGADEQTPAPSPTPTPPPSLSPSPQDIRAAEAARVQATLNAARESKATLIQLSEAFLIAQRLKLDMTTKELGEYIRSIVQPDQPKVEVRTGSPFANLLIGALAGFFIHIFVEAS